MPLLPESVLGIICSIALFALLYVFHRLELMRKKPESRSTNGPLVCPFCAHHIADSVMYAGQDVHCPNCHSAFNAPNRVSADLNGVTAVINLVAGLAILGFGIWGLSVAFSL